MKMKWIMVLAIFLISLPIAADHYERDNIKDKYESISRSIVLVSSAKISPTEGADHPFEKFLPPGEIQPPTGERFGFGMGTGFFITDRHIVTNYHVVANADEIKLYSYAWPFEISDTKLIGYNELIDIAILEISPNEDFPRDVLEWKNTEPNIGDEVYALGHGLGQFWSLTTGILSSDYRPMPKTPFVHYYQTDAVINQGNSGGPLLDKQGHVLGINTLIWSPTSYYIGYGYAIPYQLAKIVAEEIIETGEFKIPTIGIQMGITEDKNLFALADELGYTSALEVKAIVPNSSAERFGIYAGDLIVEVDGQPTRYTPDVIEILWTKNPGDSMSIKLIRNGSLVDIDLILGEA